jgi:signal transduction histidine kinase
MSASIPERSWQDRLGGPFSISPRSFMISTSLAFIFFAQVQNLAILDSHSNLKWLLVFATATILLAGFNLLLHLTLFSNRHQHPVPLKYSLSNHGIQGFLFSLMLVVGGNLFNLKQSLSAPLLIAMMTGVSQWWGATLVLFRDQQHENKENRKSLIEKAVATQSLSEAQIESSRALDEVFAANVSQELSGVESALQDSRGKVDWSTSSELLITAASKQVREISHELNVTTAITYPRIHWARLPRNIVTHQPINVWLIAVVILVTGGSQLPQLLGTSNAFMLIGIVIAIVIGIGLPANKLMSKNPNHHAAIFITASLLMQITIPINIHFREIWKPGISQPGWQITQLLSGLTLILLSSGFGAWSNINLRLNRNLQEDLKERHIRAIANSRQIADRAREAAKVLHGSVQSKLVACSLAIDQAVANGDEARIQEAIDNAIIILRTPLSSENVGASISEEVHRKVSLWNEICNIKVTINEVSPITDPHAVVTIGRVVEEGISNAIRHGRARNIEVKIDVDTDNQIDIHILDDGNGPQNGNPSLGSALLNQASNGNWSLKALEKGADLHLSISG